MPVSRCPSCGDLYLASADRCSSCDVDLVEVAEEAREPASTTPSVVPAREHERHELHSWTMEGRRLLDGMLHREGIPRSWQGTALLTPESEADRVADLIAAVGAGDARIGDVDDGEDVAYDLTGWSDAARGELVAALAEAGVEHGWDGDGDLTIGVDDEERVDAIFSEIVDEADDGDDGDGDGGDGDDASEEPDDDGLLVQETLSNLFVGADRLMHNPLDGTAARLVVEGRDEARSLRLPFGFERLQWRAILVAAGDLADAFEPGAIDDDVIRDRAAALRSLLRDVV